MNELIVQVGSTSAQAQAIIDQAATMSPNCPDVVFDAGNYAFSALRVRQPGQTIRGRGKFNTRLSSANGVGPIMTVTGSGYPLASTVLVPGLTPAGGNALHITNNNYSLMLRRDTRGAEFTGLAQMTVKCWCSPDAPGTHQGLIISSFGQRCQSEPYTSAFQLGINSGLFQCSVTTTSGVFSFYSRSSIIPGKVYFVAMRYTGSSLELWLGDQLGGPAILDNSIACTGTIVQTDYEEVTVGVTSPQQSSGFPGIIDSLSISNTAETIGVPYNAKFGPTGNTMLLMNWDNPYDIFVWVSTPKVGGAGYIPVRQIRSLGPATTNQITVKDLGFINAYASGLSLMYTQNYTLRDLHFQITGPCALECWNNCFLGTIENVLINGGGRVDLALDGGAAGIIKVIGLEVSAAGKFSVIVDGGSASFFEPYIGATAGTVGAFRARMGGGVVLNAPVFNTEPAVALQYAMLLSDVMALIEGGSINSLTTPPVIIDSPLSTKFSACSFSTGSPTSEAIHVVSPSLAGILIDAACTKTNITNWSNTPNQILEPTYTRAI